MPQDIKNKDLLKLQRGLKALESTSEGASTKRLEYSIATRWKILKNLAILDRAIDIYAALETKLVDDAGYVPGEQISTATPEDKARALAFHKAKTELNNLPTDIELIPLTRQELEEKNQKNPIPLAVMADIWEIVDKDSIDQADQKP